jgi:hypothetical protein
MFIKTLAPLPSTTEQSILRMKTPLSQEAQQERALADAVLNFDGVSVSAIPSMVEGLSKIGHFERLPIRLVETAQTYKTREVPQGNFMTLERVRLPGVELPDPREKVLRGPASATETIDFISSTLLRAQLGSVLVARERISDEPAATRKAETRRLFSAAFYEMRDILEERTTIRATRREDLKQATFRRGGLQEMHQFRNGHGPEAESFGAESELADQTFLKTLGEKIRALHVALSAIDSQLPWG